MVDITTNI